ncbi:ankyrin repeat domain-containing protein 29-like [Physella acuta]|uniref:ankyrin repeat domain-containing protein 29-like n=1 Tax=Physella acuta TaxID=109671 RepID=UPI0027DE50BB|nr:ankyrin repeat domain-containing protein 29-like [Physella acuta]
MSCRIYASDIFNAAKLGNIEPLHIASINCKKRYGETALMMSVDANNVLALKTLLSAGADPNISRNNNDGITALAIAVVKNRVECVKELIRAGAFLNCKRGLKALKMARDETFLDAVVEGEQAMKKYIKQDSDQRGTAVYVAFKKNCFNLLIALIDSGVSLSLRSLSYKDTTENKKMTTLLLKAAEITLNEKVGDGQTLLKQAIRLKDIQFLKFLIENHVDLNVADSTENTCRDGQVALVNVLLAGAKMEAVR